MLIVSLCIAFIGYLLAFSGEIGDGIYRILYWNISSTGAMFANLLVFKIIPCGLLAMAMVYSIQALDLTKLGMRGASPSYTLDEYFNYDLYKLAEGLLEDYNDRINQNETVLADKDSEMEKARNWLFLGIPVAIILVLIREIAPVFN